MTSKEKHNAVQRAAWKKKAATETPEQREKRLAYKRAQNKKRYANLTPEKKQEMFEYAKEYHRNNAEHLNGIRKERYASSPELRARTIERSKAWHKENREKHIAAWRKYYQEHKEELREKVRIYNLERYKRYNGRPEQAWRFTKEYNHWRRDVYKRDNHTCQACGANGCQVHAHHIKPAIEYIEERYNVDNGITLCAKCHKETHKKH